MRLGWSKSANSISYYVYKSAYIDGKRTTRLVEKLGTEAKIRERYGVDDAKKWAQDYIAKLNRLEEEAKSEILIRYSPNQELITGEQQLFNGGYLFLQDIYYSLGLDKICRAVSRKYDFDFDLNTILSRLIYGRILSPSSKLSTFETSKEYIEQPGFELQHIYRGLSYIAKESDYIQSALYKNSLQLSKRKTGVIYYDCTNYFFEIEQEDGIKQYGISKEHRPNPIVQMGMFMDGEGIPLAFSINPGNTNEQTTLKPLEEKLLADFSLSKFVVCTDAGLSSYDNRRFNDEDGRAFVTTQPLKTLKKHLMDWALSPEGWRTPGKNSRICNLSEIDEEADKDIIFYKDTWINENDFEQHLVVTYSVKSKNYQRSIRDKQIERARTAINGKTAFIDRKRQTDYKRFIRKDSCTKEGEVADKCSYRLREEVIEKEELFDGFYAVCTNLNDDAETIVKINQQRWEIEECFRIMKTDFKSRPVYLSREDRIKAHFITCFLSLVIYRYLEKKLCGAFTCQEILNCLKKMNFMKQKGIGYFPTYTRSNLTDALHDSFGFRTDYQIIAPAKMKNICSHTKKK